mgnify:CR=1 FL=1
MRRCCFFFLAFVAAIFLAVITGAVDNREAIPKQVNPNTQAPIAAQDENSQRNPLKDTRNKAFKTPEP